MPARPPLSHQHGKSSSLSSNTRLNCNALGVVAPQLIIRVLKNGEKHAQPWIPLRRMPVDGLKPAFRRSKRFVDSLDTTAHTDLNSP